MNQMRFAVLLVTGEKYIVSASNIVDACIEVSKIANKSYIFIDLVYCLTESKE